MATKTKSRSAGPWALLFKIGGKLLTVLAKLMKVAKVGKLALGAASFGIYAALFSWKFALLLMGSLFVHELGHIWAMKRCGMRTKGVYFIPLLGAAAVTDESFPTRRAEAFIALMGPIWGFALALLTYGVYWKTGTPLFAALAGWMAMLNLFNLLPVNPLDGGRVMKSLAFSISNVLGTIFLALGLVGAFMMAHKFGFGLVIFLTIIGSLELLMSTIEIIRAKYRRAITIALSTELGCEPTTEAIRTALEAALGDESEDLTPEAIDANLKRYGKVQWYESTAYDAVEALRRDPDQPRFLEPLRENHDLMISDRTELKSCALIKYLEVRTMEPLTGLQWAASLIGYLALAAALGALMFAVAHIPAAAAALQVFMN